jgi:predicted alpha/beta hydrolase
VRARPAPGGGIGAEFVERLIEVTGTAGFQVLADDVESVPEASRAGTDL